MTSSDILYAADGLPEATVVGVAERGFSVPSNRLLWMPLTAYGAVYSATPVHLRQGSGGEGPGDGVAPAHPARGSRSTASTRTTA